MPRKTPRRLLSNRGVQFALGVLALLLLVYLVLDWIVMPLYTRQGSERPVPRLVGLSREEARSVAESIGFQLVEGVPKLSANLPEGSILEQRPMPGAMAKPGRKINVVPAAAQERGTVPDLIGLELRDAQLRVKNAGLVNGDSDISYRFAERTPKGYVLSQDPKPGKRAEPGNVVKIVISMGPQPEHFYVPYLMEKPVGEAVTALREAGLKMGRVVRKETDQYPSGTVIAQSVRSGEEVQRNTAVDLVVAVRPGSRPEAPADTTAPQRSPR